MLPMTQGWRIRLDDPSAKSHHQDSWDERSSASEELFKCATVHPTSERSDMMVLFGDWAHEAMDALIEEFTSKPLD